MIKQHSWTRIQYAEDYRLMRRGFSFGHLLDCFPDEEEILKAADYSYQAYGYEQTGWVSDLRRKRFHAIKYRITSSGEYLPF